MENKQLEKTLDPQDWQEFRQLGHRMLDEMLDHLESLEQKPVWQPIPSQVRTAIQQEPVPLEPQGVAAVYEEFKQNVLPYPNGNAHPRFWGWVQSNGTPLGMMADMLAAGMNAHMAGFDQAPVLVELQVLQWLAQLMGMSADSSGLLTSGGSVANILALAVARQAKASFDVRGQGLQGGEHPRLRLYCSTETHSWAKKAVELLGLGRVSLCSIPVNGQYQMRTDLLREAIAADRAAGYRPICVIGTAGTVNTGATDDLAALAGICQEQNLWFHVDGAFGALAYWSPRLRPALKGLELVDSIAFDLHKWGYLPFEVGCMLVRDAEAHRAAFATAASYLAAMERGPAVGRMTFADRGIELTRGFKALKVWMSFKAHGVHAITELVEQNVAQARYLAGLVNEHPELELLAPVSLNIVCFRYVQPGMSDEMLDSLNNEVLLRLQESGVAVPSSTVLDGRFAIRVSIVNHRSRREDFDLLARSVVELGRQVAAQMLALA
ncbi:MAG: pyridoxal phosphate-dependent decarboxylase family protein [Acidobacteriaceae bacterium]